MKPLALISMWFGGRWPVWFDLHLETCRLNPEVDWLIYSDQPPPPDVPSNVRIYQTTMRDFLGLVGDRIGLDLSAIQAPYKLCDLRPAFGEAFEDELSGYRSYGYCDLDVFFGRIRHFYTDEVLERYDVISTHLKWLSGHLGVFRNTPRVRKAYRKIQNWAVLAADREHHALDEGGQRKLYTSGSPIVRFGRSLVWRALFVERYTSPDTQVPWHDGSHNWPSEWYWRDGRLTNNLDGPAAEYLYLHVMAWTSARYRRSGPPPWAALTNPVQVTVEQARRNGFVASPRGLHPFPLT